MGRNSQPCNSVMKAQTEKHKPVGECKVTNVTVSWTGNVKTTGEDNSGPVHMLCSSSSMQLL